MITTDLFESQQLCPECGGPAFSDLILAEKKDACYNKVRSRYKVWPSAYASGALVQCRKKGAANWGNKSESLNEFAPGGDEGNSPYAYAIALKEMARLYAEGAFDYDLAPGSKEQNESDAEDISQVADAFMNQGMEAGREAYNMVDTGVRDEMDSYLKDQGFNVQNDIHAEYQKDVERYQNSPQGQAQAQAQAAKNAEYAKGAAARKANEVVISAMDATTGEEEFSKISFDRGSVSPEQLRAKIQRSVAELKQHFVDYPGGNSSERIIKVTIGGKPVDINQGIAEDHDNGEYSDEAGMAHGNLITIAKAARGLLDTIDQHEDLPEWVQEKIAKVEGMLVSAWNYLQSQEAQGIDPRITEVYGTLAEAWSDVRQRMELVEEFDIIQRVVEGLAHHNGVDQEVIWEDLESLTDDELYVFAVTTPIMESQGVAEGEKKPHPQTWHDVDPKLGKQVDKMSQAEKVKKGLAHPDTLKKKGVAEGSDNIRSMIQQYEDMVELVYDLPPGRKKNIAINKRDALEAQIEAMPGGSEALRQWAKSYNDAMDEGVAEDWQKVNKRDKTDGMSRKAVKAYRREHPGSKLKTAVTTKPSKLKKGSKASKRRKSYCSRSRGQMKMHHISCAKTPDKAICKARRRWNCESLANNNAVIAEMDTQQPKGRIKSDGTRSHSTYGSRDHYSDADPQHTAKPTKAEKMMKHAHDVMMKSMSTADKVKKGWRNPNIDEGSEEQVYKVVALDKGNALKKPTKLNVKASSIEDVFSRLAANDWYALSIDGVEVVAGKRLKQGVAEGLPQTLRKVVPGYAKREIDKKMDAGKFGKTDADKDANFQRYKKIQDKLKEQGVAEVSDDTLTSYLSKVHADSQKHPMDPSKRPPHKASKSVTGFARAFNKLDARKAQTDEEEKRGRGRPPAGSPDPTPFRAGRVEKTATGIRHHADSSRYGGTIPDHEDDRLMSRSQISKLGKITEPIDEISKQKLGDYLHAAHKDVVDRASSASFQSGQAGDRYNRADVSGKERQREKGMARAVSRLTRENNMADELAAMAMRRNPNALVRVDGKTLQSPLPGPKPAGTTAPRAAPAFDPEAEYSDDYSVWHRRTQGVKEGTSVAEAWARRYPNLHADIAECKSSGDSERLKRLMAIKNIINS